MGYYDVRVGSTLCPADVFVALDDAGNIWTLGYVYYNNTVYFAGSEPDFLPPLHLAGSPFRQEVWALLRQIPYGETTTYRALAEAVARKRGLRQMSAQAVGGAVGHNPISIIVPCHRVVGSDGSLTGYAGGLERKVQLLRLEGVDMSRLYVPKKGTAL